MTSPRRSARPAFGWMVLGLLALAPSLARAAPVDLFFERAVLSAAGERCGFFAPDTAAALSAAVAQARGAALRAGAAPATLDAAEREARRHGGRADCAAPKTVAAADRVKNAFAGFEKVTRLAYPGEVAGWRADRTAARAIRWRLAQDVSFGRDRLTFGLAGVDRPGALIALARFADGATPYGARLALRDRDRTLGPYIAQARASGTMLPLARRMPPRSAVVAYAAQARSPAGQDLLPKDAAAGWAFRFPPAAAQALAALDPREAVAVEFLFPDNSVRTAYVEVGDFAAGRAFLQLAAR